MCKQEKDHFHVRSSLLQVCLEKTTIKEQEIPEIAEIPKIAEIPEIPEIPESAAATPIAKTVSIPVSTPVTKWGWIVIPHRTRTG